MKNETALPENDYFDLLKTAITQIKSSRNAIALQVNTTANSTYWSLGKLLHERKIEGGYGSNVINRLSVDLKSEFLDMGLSPRNLWNMKLFYERYAASDKKLLQLVALLKWGHNLLLINKKLSDDETYYYAKDSYNLVFLGLTKPVAELELEKEERENQSIGIILCAEKDHLDVELALQDINKPIAVSDYELYFPKKELQTLVINELNANDGGL